MSDMLHRRRLLAAAGATVFAGPALAQAPQVAPAAPAPTPAAPPVKVTLMTDLGPVVFGLAADKAPLTCANFLRYVDGKRLDGASFYRAVKASNDPTSGLVQGGIQGDPARVLPPVAHEPTSQTGLRHVDGTISMARWEPGSAKGEFFVCLGYSGYLDAIPARPGDNMGYAAFGQVLEGMDIIRKIHQSPVSATAGEGAMKGQMLEPQIKIISVRRTA